MTSKTSGRHPRQLTHNGETRTVAEWAEATGIKRSTIHTRLHMGFTVADALDPHYTSRAASLHSFDGRTMSVASWARATGIDAATLRARIRRGMAIGEAINHPRWKHSAPRKDRGAVSNLPASLGTGGGSTAQETPNIDFSKDAAE